mmetsp:Transcript_26008/g.65367  ORF Transcript_26008/g.65367 Transcript_26008/m.65367 type:complete len:123 (+) Transcript_26008:169-537(+)
MKTIQLDVEFLAKCNIVDYSLVLTSYFNYPNRDRTENQSNNSIFEVCCGGLPWGTAGVHVLGIIDILSQHNAVKEMERLAKTYLLGQPDRAVQRPPYYRDRFITYMKTNLFTDAKRLSGKQT